MINLQKELKFWQSALSLRDWDIEIEWSKPEDMPLSGAQACISTDFENAKAHIWVSRMTVPVTPEAVATTRENIVHELLHVHLERWDDKAPDVERHREKAINLIAKGLVNLYELNNRPGPNRDSVSIAGKPPGRGSAIPRVSNRNKTGTGSAKPRN